MRSCLSHGTTIIRYYTEATPPVNKKPRTMFSTLGSQTTQLVLDLTGDSDSNECCKPLSQQQQQQHQKQEHPPPPINSSSSEDADPPAFAADAMGEYKTDSEYEWEHYCESQMREYHW